MADLNRNLQKLKDAMEDLKSALLDVQERAEDLKTIAGNIEIAIDDATEQIDDIDNAISEEAEISEEDQQAQAKLEQEAALGRQVMQLFNLMPALQQMLTQCAAIQDQACANSKDEPKAE